MKKAIILFCLSVFMVSANAQVLVEPDGLLGVTFGMSIDKAYPIIGTNKDLGLVARTTNSIGAIKCANYILGGDVEGVGFHFFLDRLYLIRVSYNYSEYTITQTLEKYRSLKEMVIEKYGKPVEENDALELPKEGTPASDDIYRVMRSGMMDIYSLWHFKNGTGIKISIQNEVCLEYYNLPLWNEKDTAFGKDL